MPAFLVLLLMAFASGVRANGSVSGQPPANGEKSGVKKDLVPGEVGETLKEVAREQMEEGTQKWERALQRLSAHRPSGWLLCVVLGILGLALLGFGDRMVEKAFVPVVSLVGVGAGGYLGLQLCILLFGYPSETTQAGAIFIGIGVFGVLYAVAAVRARPVAWMLVVATPFFMLSAMLAGTSPLVATVAAIVGAVLAILACLRHHVLATISTAMLGAFSLTFSWGLLMHMIRDRQYRAFFGRAIDHPYVLGLIIILIIGAGVDFQLLFSREEE